MHIAIDGVELAKGTSLARLQGVLGNASRIEPLGERQLVFFDEQGISAVLCSANSEVLMLRVNVGARHKPYLARNSFNGIIVNHLGDAEKVGLNSLLEEQFVVGHPSGYVAFPSDSYVIWIGVDDDCVSYLGLEWDVAKTKSALGLSVS